MLPDSIDSERAVSPVIGVILMVAITVTLAAVVGAFVMGIGGSLMQPAPQANLEMADADEKLSSTSSTGDDEEKVLHLEHRGGDNLKLANLKLVIEKKDGTVKYVDSDMVDDSGFDSESYLKYNATVGSGSFSSDAELSVGEKLTVEEAVNSDISFPDGQYEVTLIHKSSNSIVDSQTVSIE